MTYIDKRALQNGESELSLIPRVNLNQVIQDIIDPQVFPTPSDDISFSTQEIGRLDISQLNGQYFTALDLGVFSTTNSLEDVAKDISPCKFAKMTFTVTNNTSNQDVIIWLLSGETQIGTVAILAEQTGYFKATGDFDNPEYLSICFNVTRGTGIVVISEITTTFTTGTNTPPESVFTITDDTIKATAYPNTRNDYLTGDPVNLLTTDANGKIQSFNTGITADISILGITLRFANGVLVEYIP